MSTATWLVGDGSVATGVGSTSAYFFLPLLFRPSFQTFLPLASLHLSLPQGLSQCLMTSGTTTLRPESVMQWLLLPRRPPPWCWTGGRTRCWSRAALGHLTRRGPTRATPRKYWSESTLGSGWLWEIGVERLELTNMYVDNMCLKYFDQHPRSAIAQSPFGICK